MLLAGDIGGTKTVLALFDPAVAGAAPLCEITFRSADFPSLEAVVARFLQQADQRVTHASFGLAGPVTGDTATVTNLSWPTVDAARLRAAFGFHAVRLLNDLEAIAYAVPLLGPHDLHTLRRGTPEPHGAIGVIAPGTGLGEALLLWDGARYRAYPSEGGNVDFAPTDELQIELLRFMRRRYAQVSYELVCSGLGMPNLYAFLKQKGHIAESPWVSAQLAAAHDPTPVIVGAALDTTGPCPLCRATLDLFVAILGAEAGNLALKVLATGGLYIGGGIAPRIIPALDSPTLLAALCAKGPFTALMEQVPIHVICNPKAALLGAGLAAKAHPGNHRPHKHTSLTGF
jgi:glucokinase